MSTELYQTELRPADMESEALLFSKSKSNLYSQTEPEFRSGFIISRQQYDVDGLCVFEIWVESDLQKVKLLIRGQRPVCFVRTQDKELLREAIKSQSIPVELKNIDLKSFENENMTAIYCLSLRQYYKVKQIAETYQIVLFEDDIKPIERYLMERFVKGGVTFAGDQVVTVTDRQESYLVFDNVKVKASDYQPNPFSILSIDIECNEHGDLFTIGLHMQGSHCIIYNSSGIEPTIKQTLLENSTETANVDLNICWVKDETQLLQEFVKQVNQFDPDCLVGWNFISFDVRLIVKAAKRNKVDLAVGRDGSNLQFNDGQRGSQKFPDRAHVAGRVVLDGIDVMKNATYHFPSFSLNNVSKALLDDEKVDLASGKVKSESQHQTESGQQVQQNQISHEGGDKLSAIKWLYKNKPFELASYNLQDCMLVSRLFEQERLLAYLITRSQLTGLELDKTGGSVAAFTNLYLPQMHRKGWIAPNLVDFNDYVNSPGGFVMDSIPGIHKNVLVFDFKSLYPSIIRTFNIDPVALIESKSLTEQQIIPGFRGGSFSRDKSILSSMLDTLWKARDKAKQSNDKVLSNAIKIIMNSFYGVLGSAGCRFYDTKLASSITMRGHWVLNESKDWFHKNGLKVIYGDTDSVFVSLEDSEYSFDEAKVLEAKLNKWWQQKIDTEFGITSKLEMEFETHYSPFFMPTIRGAEAGSKKRYAGKLHLNDGSTKIIFKGLESVRSDWTELAKNFQKTLFELIFSEQPCYKFVEDTIAKLNSGALNGHCIYQKRIRQDLSSYVKTTPPQIRAARQANERYGREIYKKGSVIKYVISVNGPYEVNDANDSNQPALDYEHYISKQLFPIAESILHTTQRKVLSLFEKQLSLI